MFCGPDTVDVSRGEAEVSVNKYFIIYWVSKEKKSTTNQSNMCKKDYLLPDMAPWGSVDLLFTGEYK